MHAPHRRAGPHRPRPAPQAPRADAPALHRRHSLGGGFPAPARGIRSGGRSRSLWESSPSPRRSGCPPRRRGAAGRGHRTSRESTPAPGQPWRPATGQMRAAEPGVPAWHRVFDWSRATAPSGGYRPCVSWVRLRDLVETFRGARESCGQSLLTVRYLEGATIRDPHPRQRLGNHESVP